MTIDPSGVNIPRVIAELQRLYAAYETALTTNDVETLVPFFWDSPLATRFGVTENLHGFDQIAAFRKGRNPANLARTIERLVITTFGEDHGEITVEFSRSVEGRTVQGRQSQTWVRLGPGWRIVSAHISLLS